MDSSHPVSAPELPRLLRALAATPDDTTLRVRACARANAAAVASRDPWLADVAESLAAEGLAHGANAAAPRLRAQQELARSVRRALAQGSEGADGAGWAAPMLDGDGDAEVPGRRVAAHDATVET